MHQNDSPAGWKSQEDEASWLWGINPEEPAYKRTILLSLLGQEAQQAGKAKRTKGLLAFPACWAVILIHERSLEVGN